SSRSMRSPRARSRSRVPWPRPATEARSASSAAEIRARPPSGRAWSIGSRTSRPAAARRSTCSRVPSFRAAPRSPTPETRRRSMAVIAGNWKMHLGPTDTRAFFERLSREHVDAEHQLVVFPPAISIPAALASRGPRVEIGVQNIHWEDAGAFTGEISAPIAADAGATFALVGHSERRHVFGETDDEVRMKVEAALRAGLTPVVCVGETLEERRAGRVDEVIARQLGAV